MNHEPVTKNDAFLYSVHSNTGVTTQWGTITFDLRDFSGRNSVGKYVGHKGTVKFGVLPAVATYNF